MLLQSIKKIFIKENLESREWLDREGNPQYYTVGLNKGLFSDLYHHFLRKPWPLMLFTIFAVFLAINIIFTFLYVKCNGINNAVHLYDYFFFSVQTLSTIGYGFMYPTNFCSHSLVAIQSFMGLLFVSFLTGLIFAKFSLPRAKIMFTKNAVVTYEGDDLFFKFRMSNIRANQILDANIKAVLLKQVIRHDGSKFRKIHEMELVRSVIPMFALSFTVQHKIDEKSPFYQETHESLVEKGAVVVITLTGIDDTISQTIVSRYLYEYNDIVWNEDFKDVLFKDEYGRPYFDYRNFHAFK